MFDPIAGRITLMLAWLTCTTIRQSIFIDNSGISDYEAPAGAPRDFLHARIEMQYLIRVNASASLLVVAKKKRGRGAGRHAEPRASHYRRPNRYFPFSSRSLTLLSLPSPPPASLNCHSLCSCLGGAWRVPVYRRRSRSLDLKGH